MVKVIGKRLLKTWVFRWERISQYLLLFHPNFCSLFIEFASGQIWRFTEIIYFFLIISQILQLFRLYLIRFPLTCITGDFHTPIEKEADMDLTGLIIQMLIKIKNGAIYQVTTHDMVMYCRY